MKLTVRTVATITADPSRDVVVWDSELAGFGVRMKPSGVASYMVQYRNAAGLSRRVTLGKVRVLAPEEARKLAREKLAEVAKGGDPAESRLEDRKAMTMARLCQEYLAAAEAETLLGKRGLPKKASTLYTDRGRIERHILPLLGTRKVRDLTSPDIVRFMRDVSSGKTATDIKTGFRGRAIVSGGRGTAARTVGLLGGILSFAVSEGVIPSNPVRGVKRPADERREVLVSPDQYRALGAALATAEANREPWQALAAVKLIALTGCRRGEIERLVWEDVDLPGRCLRLSDSKTGKSVRPLGSAAAGVLKGLPKSGVYVLPGLSQSKNFTGLPKAWKRLIQTPQQSQSTTNLRGEHPLLLGALTPHGLRHGFASVAADIGMTEITIAALLGHSAATVTGRYIHHVDTALVVAADRVSARIADMMSGRHEGAEVVDLARRA